jgi:hypothetical protein
VVMVAGAHAALGGHNHEAALAFIGPVHRD